MSELVEAARYDQRIEADLARLYLESEDIDAVLFDADTFVCTGAWAPVRLMVVEEDLKEARALLGKGRYSR